MLALLMALSGVTLSLRANAEAVPLSREHGTFVVPVVINDKITLNFTLDSGAADVSIPADVFTTLRRAGTITRNDLLDTGVYELADGSRQTSQRFRIRSLKVGGLELRDVVASVAPTAGTLLLGQSFLARLKYWTIDNQRHLLVFNVAPTVATSATATPSKSEPHPDDPFIGTWIWNPIHYISTQRTPNQFALAPRRASRTFTETAEGVELTATWVEYYGVEPKRRTAKLDGNDYPWIPLSVSDGTQINATIALTRVDRRTVEGALKINGKVVGISVATVSDDGKALAFTTKGPDFRYDLNTEEQYDKRIDEDPFVDDRPGKVAPSAATQKFPIGLQDESPSYRAPPHTDIGATENSTRWVRVARTETATVYMDPSSIRVTGQVRDVWLKSIQVPKSKRGSGDNTNRWVASSIVSMSFDCSAKAERIEALVEYFDDSTNFTVPFGAVRDPWQPVAPETVEEKSLIAVCSNG
jgi:clan AA aspartic protease (TIGR02281 family)